MGAGVERYVVPYAVGLALPLLVALTWSPGGEWTSFKWMMRDYQAAIIAVELFVILVALREGLLKALPRWHWSWPALAAASILAVVAIATALQAPLQYLASVLTLYWLIHGAFGLSIVHLCGRIFAPEDLVRALMVGFAIFAAQFLLFLHHIPDWSGFDWRGGLLSFEHIRHAGYYLAPMAALGIGMMAIAQRRAEWAWAFATACAATGIALWTGSRGAALAIAATMVVGLVLAPPVRAVRAWGGGLASIAIAAAVVAAVPAAPSPMLGISRTVEATASKDVTTGRAAMWENVAGAIRKRPVFGHGEGQMRSVAPFSDLVQPHNSILQITLAWGIVGLLCVLTLAVAYARRAIPAVRRHGGMLVPLFLAMTALAILSLYDGALYYPFSTAIFAASAAVIASKWRSTAAGPELSDDRSGLPPATGRAATS